MITITDINALCIILPGFHIPIEKYMNLKNEMISKGLECEILGMELDGWVGIKKVEQDFYCLCNQKEKIVLIGHSEGASLAIYLASKSDKVKGLVGLSLSFLSFELIKQGFKHVITKSQVPYINIIRNIYLKWLSLSLLQKKALPMLLIYGNRDVIIREPERKNIISSIKTPVISKTIAGGHNFMIGRNAKKVANDIYNFMQTKVFYASIS